VGHCNIDHSLDDVKKKYESQMDFLPDETKPMFADFFQKEHSQELLNEVFHLLKKYDLVSEEDREVRNKRLLLIIHNV
jgi:DNA-directed RNA polymerase sigma subunit (sigma70/sigma32)